MKKTLLSLLLFSAVSIYAQSVPPPNVYVGYPHLWSFPTLACADSAGTPHLILSGITTWWNGESWTGNVPGNFRDGVFSSTDGGATWTPTDSNIFGDTITHNYTTHSYGNDPVCGMDGSGNCYVAYNGNTISRSTDWGRTWMTTDYTEPFTQYPADNDADHPAMAVNASDGSIDLIWAGTGYYIYYNYGTLSYDTVHLGGGDTTSLWFARSTNHGASFSVPHLLTGAYSTSQEDCYWPDIAVNTAGTIFVGFATALPSSYEEYVHLIFSTDGGTNWIERDSANAAVYDPLAITYWPMHQPLSLAAAPGGSMIAIAYESSSGYYIINEDPDTIGVVYSLDSGATWTQCSGVGFGHYPQMPKCIIDSLNRIFVTYYGSTDGGHLYSNYYFDVSKDSGKTWTEITVNDTAFLMEDTVVDSWGTALGDYGSGAWQGMVEIDTGHIGVSWSQMYSGAPFPPHVKFASIALGTEFVNAMGSTYDFLQTKLVNHKTSTPSTTDTILSTGYLQLIKDTSYTVHPDSLRHNAYSGIPLNNFEQFTWNNSSSTGNEVFNFPFTSSGVLPQVELANFVPLDSLKVNCDLGGANGGEVLWSINTATYSDSTASPFAIDSAFDNNLFTTKSYFFKVDTVVTALGTNWYFDRWQTGNSYITGNSLTFIEAISADTSFTAIYKGEMRGDSALNFSNQRCIVWDSLTGKYLFTYQSGGNIYLTHSTDGSAPQGCSWVQEQRINNASGEYGKSFNPSITYCNKITWPPSGTDTNRFIVSYEDTFHIGSLIYRQIIYNEYNALTYALETSDSVMSLNGLPEFPAANPAAPMVCPIYGHPFIYGRAIITWSDDSSLCIGIINPVNANCPMHSFPAPASERVPNSTGGHFSAVEPGYNDCGTDTSDFYLAWFLKGQTDGRYLFGYSGETLESYLRLACYAGSPTPIFTYTTPDTVNRSGGIPSLVVTPTVKPLIASALTGGYTVITPNTGVGVAPFSVNTYAFSEVTMRASPSHDSSLGGIVNYFIMQPQDWATYYYPMFSGASVTVYNDENPTYRLMWTKTTSAFYSIPDSIQFLKLSAYVSPFAIDADTLVHTFQTFNVRTPCQPFSRNTDSMNNRAIWIEDSVGTHILHRYSTNGSPCNAPDNYASIPVHDYNGGIAMVHDSAIKFESGEYQLMTTSGAAAAVHQQAISLTSGYHSINDAANLMRSEYFRIAHDTIKIGMFGALMVGDTNALNALDTTTLTFVTELRDSATGSLLQTLGSTGIAAAPPHVVGSLGTDTVTIISDSGHTAYIRLTIDTLKTGHGFAFIPTQDISETQLSTLASDTGGFSKQINPERAVGLFSTPINLTSAPNPFYPRSDISFTVPQSESGYPVQVKVFSTDGRCVATLVNAAQMQAGRFTVTLDGTNLPTAEYIVRVMEHDYQQNGIVVLMK